eukprot:gnl/MRDRNA2_/MRDRNA2_68726_c0_seq3.p1 gnl/MRDRNA2_/MRDRNA2_68726_c0~~gnl/MRDRNA2_/MRDRNA2_68726_c0_seq3.p1  ORF type:complete len:261 (+),score=36.27 gnl/MRDRNA2_/MRDRNA2_68726_c0_seq3:448-1230(+)
MGMHKSGTHVLEKYIRKFFNIAVQPRSGDDFKTDGEFGYDRDGIVNLGRGAKLWKHTVPLSNIEFPETAWWQFADGSGKKSGPVMVICVVREAVSWILSLARHAYEIYPRGAERPDNKPQWLLGDIELRLDHDFQRNPFWFEHFKSAVELWAVYVGGYLEGRFAARDGTSPTIIVRHEDLLHRPGMVVEELRKIGLPRNKEPFQPLEQSLTDAGETRQTIIERDARAHRAKRWCAGDLDFIRAELSKEMPLLDRLGYHLP